MHPQIDVLVSELIKRKKFVFLCTNALLLPKKIEKFKPSPYFAWVVHIDGLQERHDESVCKEGVFDDAVAAVNDSRYGLSAAIFTRAKTVGVYNGS